MMRFEEFAQKLMMIETAFPADAGDSLEKAARKMVKAIRKKTPSSTASHPHKLNKSWTMEMVEAWGKAPKAEIKSEAPHFHLVNRGVQNPTDAHGNPKPEWRAGLNKNVGFLERTVRKNWPDIKEKMQKDFYKKVRDHLG